MRLMKFMACFFALTALMISGCKGDTITAHWTGTPVIIDGKMTDWADIQGTFAEKLSTINLLKNDDENIYFLVMFSDISKLNMALRSGFTVWVDKDGRKKKNFGYRFVSDQQRMGSRDGNRNQMPQREMFNRDQQNARPEIKLPVTGKMYIIGKEDDPGVPVNASDPKSAAIEFGNCEGMWVCEMRIPLHPAAFLPNAVKLNPGEFASFGFEIKAEQQMDRSQGGRPPEGGMGAPGGGMGGEPPSGGMSGEPPSGGMGGGGGRPGGGGHGDYNSGMKGGEVWFSTTLVKSNATTTMD